MLAVQFQRRQRQATLLVAGCVAFCCAVTALALVTVMGSSPRPDEPDAAGSRSASIIWKVMPAQLRIALGATEGTVPTDNAADKILASP